MNAKIHQQRSGAGLGHRVMARPLSLSTAVEFLEADPWFHGSGYIKAELIKFINRQELKRRWAKLLRKIAIAAVDREDRREFRSYCRLACKVDAPELRWDLKRRIENEDKGIRRRARWMLDYLSRCPARPVQKRGG